MKTDRQLQKDVIDELRWDPSISEEGIAVSVSAGVVILNGQVPSYMQKIAAQQAAERVTGVRAVADGLAVVATPVMRRSESPVDVRERIESALLRSAELDAKSIVVHTNDGEVTLRGTVRSWAERQDAERAAWSAPGVHSVVDRLAVAS
jgi:osmotically-inducible protein OsmY